MNPVGDPQTAGDSRDLASPEQVIEFWFETLSYDHWFGKSASLDATIRARFGVTLAAAARCELWHWRNEAIGRLAEIVVLDQFSRNIFRDTARAFENDALALALAQEAIASGVDELLEAAQRAFLYMPYMHSESLAIHEQALRLFNQAGLEKEYGFEHRHLEILKRFGRYPHRNAALGRSSTADETAFLQQQGSSF